MALSYHGIRLTDIQPVSRLFHHRLEGSRNGGGEAEELAGDGMDEFEGARVEGEAVDGRRAGTVAAVTGYGVPEIFHVDADLVFATRFKLNLHEGVAVG